MKGIYRYIDSEDMSTVYVGKDSYIDKDTRHKCHFAHSLYDKQQINRILQNNPERYNYQVLYCSEDVSDEQLNILEKIFIERYDPPFNYTKGGDGTKGYHHTSETKEKISKANTGKTRTLESRKLMSQKRKGIPAHNYISYARIVKGGITKQGKPRYCLKFKGKRLKESINKAKLRNWFLKNYPLQIIKTN